MNRILSPILVIVVVIFVIFFEGSCSSSVKGDELTTQKQTPAEPQPDANITSAEDVDPSLTDTVRSDRWTGDIDGMLQRRFVRAVVVYNKTNFFYDGPRTRGVSYDALIEFEKFLNKRLQTGSKPIHIIFVPVTGEEALKRMHDGRGDIAVGNIPIMAELEKDVDFSDPLRENARQLVVAGPNTPQISIIDDLSGKEIYVRRSSRYWLTLEKLNTKFKHDRRPLVIVREADSNLEDEDLINMVGAGQLPMTVTDDLTAALWAKVFPALKVYDQVPLVQDDRMGWAVQNGSTNFLKLINEFVKDHKQGTAFGNSVLASYLQTAKWATNNIAPGEMEKYKAAASLFKKYGEMAGIDPRLIAAQAYQESQIDQSRTSPAGAVGVMQIKPSTAAGDPINIENVDKNMENNIHAGTKYLQYIAKRYFTDPQITQMDRALFSFASYNAGPAKVAKMREKAAKDGLDSNKWFGNVELVAGHDIGAETVNYVSNIYKYYIAYKVSFETTTNRKRTGG